MADLVSYALDDGIATVTLDDGKVNVVSLDMLSALGEALDRAEDDGAVVVLTGRAGIFSAGFDLQVLTGGGTDAGALLRGGFELALRVMSFPTPVVVACSGHAIAMGLFLVLSGDHIVGAEGPFKLVANEVAIGLTLPRAAAEICRHRLTPAAFGRATNLSETMAPGPEAVAAGFLDQVVPPEALAATAREVAERLAGLDLEAHAETKARTRGPALVAVRAAIDDELVGPRPVA